MKKLPTIHRDIPPDSSKKVTSYAGRQDFAFVFSSDITRWIGTRRVRVRN